MQINVQKAGLSLKTILALAVWRSFRFVIAEASQFFEDIFRAKAHAGIEQVGVGIDFRGKTPFLTIELCSNGIFQSPEIPAANDDAARCDEKKND